MSDPDELVNTLAEGREGAGELLGDRAPQGSWKTAMRQGHRPTRQ
jgi:hypothetical protein